MAKIDWSMIAGTVAGTVANFIVPGSGAVVSTLVDKGVDLGIDLNNKMRAAKEAGQTEESIAKSLSNDERAAMVRYMDDSAKAYEDAYTEYLKILTEGDKKVSTARKKAKISGKEVSFDAATVAGVPRSELNVFKQYPNMYTFQEFAADTGADLGYYGENTTGTGAGTTGTGAGTMGTGETKESSQVVTEPDRFAYKTDWLGLAAGVAVIVAALMAKPFNNFSDIFGTKKRKARTAKARAALQAKREEQKRISNRKK